MKIIFLNAWGGKVADAITEFVEDRSRDTDIFCLQEAYDDMKRIARNRLPDYKEIEKYKCVNENDNFPQATYVRDATPLLSSGTVMEREENVGLGLYVQIRFKERDLYVCNFHGMSRPVDKLDNPGRLRQSEGLIDFFKDKPGAKIIGGDFNLLPGTDSIQMFEKEGYRDLIKEYKVATTRNQLAWNRYPDNKQYYSDYVFVSPDIKISGFSVPNIEISDHLPLILEIV